MIKLQWFFSLMLLASMPIAHAFIPVSFEKAAPWADKVAFVKVSKVEKRKLTVEVVEVFKGHFKTKMVTINNSRFLATDRSYTKTGSITSGTHLFVLLNFQNAPLFGLSSCGTKNTIVMGQMKDSTYAEKIRLQFSLKLRKLLKDTVMKTPKTVFSINVPNYDDIKHPGGAIDHKELDELIALIENGTQEDAEATVGKILSTTTPYESILKASIASKGNKLSDTARLVEMIEGAIAVHARRQFLSPTRRNVNLQKVSAKDAVASLGKLFDHPIAPVSERGIGMVRISLTNETCSLAEALANICGNTGLSAYSELTYLGIPGAIGEERFGARGHAFSFKGALIGLRMDRAWHVPKDLKKANYRLGFDLSFTTDLISKTGSHAIFEEILYADGNLIRHHATGWTGNRSPLEPLVSSKGTIKRIKGMLRFRLPVEMRCRITPLQEDKKNQEGAYFFKTNELTKVPEGWSLTYEKGVQSRGTIFDVDLGSVLILDAKGNRLKGDCRVSSSGGSSENPQEGKVKRDYETLIFKQKPAYGVWIYPTLWEDVIMPLEFSDVQCPPYVWKLPYKK